LQSVFEFGSFQQHIDAVPIDLKTTIIIDGVLGERIDEHPSVVSEKKNKGDESEIRWCL
jgi:hypothetical protein